MLKIVDAKVWFGGVRAVDGVTLTLEQGRLYGLVGPNGSGKSTLINTISGINKLTAGTIRFNDRELSSLSGYEVSRAGVGRTFQAVRLIPTLTVRENVLLAADRLLTHSADDSPTRHLGMLRHLNSRRRRYIGDAADAVLGRVHLEEVADRYPNTLSYGLQRRVEIARALVGAPKLLLLDEPIAGMSHEEREDIANLIKQLSSEGLTQLVVEHDLRTLLAICDHLFVMNFGRCVASGEPRETAMRPEVQEAYLGRPRVDS